MDAGKPRDRPATSCRPVDRRRRGCPTHRRARAGHRRLGPRDDRARPRRSRSRNAPARSSPAGRDRGRSRVPCATGRRGRRPSPQGRRPAACVRADRSGADRARPSRARPWSRATHPGRSATAARTTPAAGPFGTTNRASRLSLAAELCGRSRDRRGKIPTSRQRPARRLPDFRRFRAAGFLAQPLSRRPACPRLPLSKRSSRASGPPSSPTAATSSSSGGRRHRPRPPHRRVRRLSDGPHDAAPGARNGAAPGRSGAALVEAVP